jgi:hypothetical protein
MIGIRGIGSIRARGVGYCETRVDGASQQRSGRSHWPARPRATILRPSNGSSRRRHVSPLCRHRYRPLNQGIRYRGRYEAAGTLPQHPLAGILANTKSIHQGKRKSGSRDRLGKPLRRSCLLTRGTDIAVSKAPSIRPRKRTTSETGAGTHVMLRTSATTPRASWDSATRLAAVMAISAMTALPPPRTAGRAAAAPMPDHS